MRSAGWLTSVRDALTCRGRRSDRDPGFGRSLPAWDRTAEVLGVVKFPRTGCEQLLGTDRSHPDHTGKMLTGQILIAFAKSVSPHS